MLDSVFDSGFDMNSRISLVLSSQVLLHAFPYLTCPKALAYLFCNNCVCQTNVSLWKCLIKGKKEGKSNIIASIAFCFE